MSQSGSQREQASPEKLQHTPGPWKIEYGETRMRWPVIYVDDEAWDGGRREIASVAAHVAKRGTDYRWRKTKDAGEAEANARLIAQAPAMRIALERIVKGAGENQAHSIPFAMVYEARAILRDIEGA